MGRVTSEAALEVQRLLLSARLDAQRGQILQAVHQLKGPVESVDHVRRLYYQVGHIVPMIVLGGSIIGSLLAMRRRRAKRREWPRLAPPSTEAAQAAGVRPGSLLAVALAGWRLWSVARVVVPELKQVATAAVRGPARPARARPRSAASSADPPSTRGRGRAAGETPATSEA